MGERDPSMRLKGGWGEREGRERDGVRGMG